MQNNLALISIITPTYNRKELLEKAILSTINQKKDIPFEWELLIVDDWSTDWTKEYIQKYLDEYKDNIKYFYQVNSWVWKARNVWLDNMNKNSDYTIFLDSDDELIYDCVYTNLNKFQDLKETWGFENILWFYNLCKDEDWNIIWNKKILKGKDEIYFNYESFLDLEINIEMLIFLKSFVFNWTLKLRFSEDVINETIMWIDMWQFMSKNWFYIILFNYVWRLYNISHNWEVKITKNISKEKFRQNAIWNGIVLSKIWNDLLNSSRKNIYSQYLFREWINWVLFWSRRKWILLILKSIAYFFEIKKIVILLISIISTRLLLFIYKIYV